MNIPPYANGLSQLKRVAESLESGDGGASQHGPSDRTGFRDCVYRWAVDVFAPR